MFDKRGKKRSCGRCGAKYYDLNRPSPACPNCGFSNVADINGKSPPKRIDLGVRAVEGSVRQTARGVKPNDENKNIRSICHEKGIKSLFHFTSLDNLPSIIQYGLLSLSDLKQKKFKYTENDSERYDRFENTVSCSISFPNYLTFYRFRRKFENRSWVLIELSVDILFEQPCLFSNVNAADNAAQAETPVIRASADKLEQMFEDFEGSKIGRPHTIRRSDLNIPKYYTTNPQAEVLIRKVILPNHFLAIHFQNNRDLETNRNMCLNPWNTIKLKYETEFFDPRSDWKHWQNVQSIDKIVYPAIDESDDEIPF